MKKSVIIVFGVIILLFGGVITLMQQMEFGPFAKEENAASSTGGDENADGTASGTSQTHLINMEPISIPIFMGDSVQSSLKLEVKVGFKINDQKNLNSGLDKIEENQQQFKMLERYMPKLQDAFFIDLISYVPRLYRRYSKLDTKLVANRLKAIGQRTIGEGKILSIDVKTSEEQEPSEQ